MRTSLVMVEGELFKEVDFRFVLAEDSCDGSSDCACSDDSDFHWGRGGRLISVLCPGNILAEGSMACLA